MMRITQDFLNHLSPVELSFIRTGIDKLYKEKVTPDTTNYENIESHVQRCPHCGSVHFVKNGFNPKHRQKQEMQGLPFSIHGYYRYYVYTFKDKF